RVTLATHNSVTRYLLPEVIEKFHKQFPKTKVFLFNRSREEILQLVENREVDFGITSLTRIPTDVEYTRLTTFKRVLITRRDHPLATKRSLTLRDIAEYPLILPPEGSNTRQNVEQALLREGIPYQIVMEIAGRDSVREY